MNMFFRVLRRWLPLAIVITGLCGLVYLLAQQSLRASANDPQIQMAEDAANAISTGAQAQTVMPTQKVDIAYSLAPFLMVFNDSGQLSASSVQLHNQPPSLPGGVLDAARQQGQNRVTWQPESGVRIAAVVVAFQGGYVLAGRSLREVEKREDQALWLSVVVMLAIWFATGIVFVFDEMLSHKTTG